MLEKGIINRRTLLRLGAASTLSIAVTPLRAFADSDTMQAAIQDVFGDRPIEHHSVSLKLPPIAENGYSVPVTVSVDSPMTDADHITRIALFSPRNPLSLISQYHLSPLSGKAEVSSRIRLAGTQTITAIAETNDGRLLSGSVETVVTLAACVVL